MIRRAACLVPLILLLASACGGGDEEETAYEWECYASESSGRCSCYEVATGSSADLGQSTATEVDSCSGYDTCKSYYDTLREQGRCDCGPDGFSPSTSQTRDIKTVDDCPED